MSNVTVESNGAYWRLTWTDWTGKAKSRSAGAKKSVTRAQANRAAMDLERELAKNPSAGTRAPTLEQWGKQYLKLKPEYDDKTTDVYDGALKRMYAHFGRDRRLDLVTRLGADEWRAAMVGEGLAENTVRKHIRTARTLYNSAITLGVVAFNPFRHIPCSPVEVDRQDAQISGDMMERVFDACPSPAWRCLFGVVYYAGLRRGESLRLEWADVLWDRNRIVVRNKPEETRTARGIKASAKQGTKRRQREVMMEPALERLLLEQRELIDDVRVCAVSDHNLVDIANKIIRRAGLTPWPRPFQTLRAARDTTWKERDQWPSFVVDAWMGHSDSVSRKSYLSVPERCYKRGEAPRDKDARIAELEAENAKLRVVAEKYAQIYHGSD